MDLSDPTRAITPTLDGAVLAALAAAGRPLTVGQVAAEAARGSEIGVRRSLGRLVDQGTVRATQMGRNVVHELNRDHVAAEVAVLLSRLRLQVWDRIRTEMRAWRVTPLYACVFGSAARGDGDAGSDIDLLVVHPVFPGERRPREAARDLRAQVVDRAGAAILASGEPNASEHWEDQLASLHDLVERWTGNALQVVDLSFHEWRRPPVEHRPLLADVRRDGVELLRARGLRVWDSEDAPPERAG